MTDYSTHSFTKTYDSNDNVLTYENSNGEA